MGEGGADQDEDDDEDGQFFLHCIFFALQFFLHCSFFVVLLGALGRSGNLKPFSLSLGFLGFAGGGKWFGVECDGHDDDDAVFFALQFVLHCSCFLHWLRCFRFRRGRMIWGRTRR